MTFDLSVDSLLLLLIKLVTSRGVNFFMGSHTECRTQAYNAVKVSGPEGEPMVKPAGAESI